MKFPDNLTPVDCNTFLGNWAFRALRRNTVQDLLAMMNLFGISQACVASADAILHRDPLPANEKLFEMTRSASARFFLYATINPAYPGWERDLDRYVELGFHAIRIYPMYHGYTLEEACANALADAAVERGLILSIPCRVEDARQRHWMDTSQDVTISQVISFAERNSNVTVLLTECYFQAEPDDPMWERLKQVRIYFDISRMTSCLDSPLGDIAKNLGHDRLLFGTGFPFKAPSASFLKIQLLNIEDDIKKTIAHDNAIRLFGVNPNVNHNAE